MMNLNMFALKTSLLLLCLIPLLCNGAVELLQNPSFEDSTMDPWHCWGFTCEKYATDKKAGSFSLKVSARTQDWMGPSQTITTQPGKVYKASSYVKILTDKAGMFGQSLQLMMDFQFEDDTHSYINVALRPAAKVSDGWILLQGDFQSPTKPVKYANFYYQGPVAGVDFAVDNATVTEMTISGDWRKETDAVIERVRKSDINVRVTTAAGVSAANVEIQILQTRKSFPFGTAVSAYQYVQSSKQKYRDFIHTHFNWAVIENALKWNQLEGQKGNLMTDTPLKTIQGLKSHNIKVRGHNLLEQYQPDWVKSLSGAALKAAVTKHIQEAMGFTKGLLEHWDVYNEMLHGQWYIDKVNDPNYDLELFKLAHATDPYPKLFLNDYSVVGAGAATGAYLEQAKRIKAANVHLGGMGVQSHFPAEVEPIPQLVKQRLDVMAQAGVPMWATEHTVEVVDEDKRADYYEKALRALYGHPAIEGILFWGFWDQAHYAGEKAALVRGDNLELTAAGKRVLDLLENQWMTDVTHSLSAGTQFKVRGFHGDYEVHVKYQGKELTNLKQTFTLDKTAKTLSINVHV